MTGEARSRQLVLRLPSFEVRARHRGTGPTRVPRRRSNRVAWAADGRRRYATGSRRERRAGIQLIHDVLRDVEPILINHGLVDALQDAGPVVGLHLVAGETQDQADAV